MSQFVTIQVGQCGNQIGEAFWPLVLHEHGIETSFFKTNLLRTQRDHVKYTDDLSDAFHSFFHIPGQSGDLSFKRISDLNAAKIKARAVLIDMEDSVVARFKQGPLRGLFDETLTVTNYPGSGNNWAVGHYVHGDEYHEQIEEAVRRIAEKCDSLHGFLMMHSLGGGTGSGLGTRTLELLADNYPHVERFVSCVYPACNQDVVTAPYNVLLATKQLVDHATCVFPADNTALLNICNSEMMKRENNDQWKYNANCKPFQDMNSIIVNMLLHLTSGSRFPGSLNTDMNEIATNLVAYPQMHYIFSSVSPVTLTGPAVSIAQNNHNLSNELFSNAWWRKNQLINIDPLGPKSVIIGSAHIVRGRVSITDIRKNIEKFQTKAKFTTWSKEATKIGLCSVPPAGHTASVLCLLNSSSMSLMLKDVLLQFDRLYQRKAHVHHYSEVDRFEDSTFHEARESVLSICENYVKIQTQNPANIPRMQLI